MWILTWNDYEQRAAKQIRSLQGAKADTNLSLEAD
jgi:hypothetical protein